MRGCNNLVWLCTLGWLRGGVAQFVVYKACGNSQKKIRRSRERVMRSCRMIMIGRDESERENAFERVRGRVESRIFGSVGEVPSIQEWDISKTKTKPEKNRRM